MPSTVTEWADVTNDAAFIERVEMWAVEYYSTSMPDLHQRVQ